MIELDLTEIPPENSLAKIYWEVFISNHRSQISQYRNKMSKEEKWEKRNTVHFFAVIAAAAVNAYTT